MKVASTVGFERAHNELLRDGGRGRVRAGGARVAGAAAAELPAIVELNRGGESAERPDARPAHAAPGRAQARGGRAARRHPHGPAVRRRARRRRHRDHGAAGRLRLQARLARRPRAGGRPDRPRRRRRPARRGPRRRRRHHPLRRLPRGRHDELARGPPPGRADRARRAGLAARSLGGGPRRHPDARRPRARRMGRAATSRAPPSRRTTTSADARRELDADRPIAVVCASGQRAAVGASLLQRHGAATCGTWSTAACRGGSARAGLRLDLELRDLDRGVLELDLEDAR